jgi:hypothetical protein
MLRRSWLKFVLGTSTAVIVVRDWFVSVAEAHGAAASTTQDPVPRTVADAIKAHYPKPVSAFVNTYPTLAAKATAQEKAKLLFLIGVCPNTAQNWDRMTLAALPDYERAALTLLRGIDRDPVAMAEVMRVIGGKTYIEARLPKLTNTELKTVMQAMAKF